MWGSTLGCIVTLTMSLLTVPLATAAQPSVKVPTIGVLSPGPPPPVPDPNRDAFRQGLRELGYVEGQNMRIEYRFAEGQYERLPELAAELVRLPADVLVTNGAGALAAKHATATIPIVFTTFA